MMQTHEYANLFPMMDAQAFAELKRDIRANGLLDSIVLYDGKILDGRNRYTACVELGIEPNFITVNGNTDPLKYVISKNLTRRHLNESQRAVIAGKLETVGQGRPNVKDANWHVYRFEAASMLNVSPRTVARVKAVEKAAPELIVKIERGEMTAHEAEKKVKEEKRKESIKQQREGIEKGVEKPIGLFDVISLDPPWPYGTEYDPNGRRAANPYPEMSLEEIKALEIPAADNSILWLWTTHRFMRYSFELLDHWGFRDVAIVTWVKHRIGLGQWLRSQTEFCIMAVKGKPLVDLTNQSTVIYAVVRNHSRKPDEFYKMVDSLCVGRKLDYFSREQREGWSQYGNDLERFS